MHQKLNFQFFLYAFLRAPLILRIIFTWDSRLSLLSRQAWHAVKTSVALLSDVALRDHGDVALATGAGGASLALQTLRSWH